MLITQAHFYAIGDPNYSIKIDIQDFHFTPYH